MLVDLSPIEISRIMRGLAHMTAANEHDTDDAIACVKLAGKLAYRLGMFVQQEQNKRAEGEIDSAAL